MRAHSVSNATPAKTATVVVFLPTRVDPLTASRVRRAIGSREVVAVYTTDTPTPSHVAQALHAQFGGSLIPYDRLSRPASEFADLSFETPSCMPRVRIRARRLWWSPMRTSHFHSFTARRTVRSAAKWSGREKTDSSLRSTRRATVGLLVFVNHPRSNERVPRANRAPEAGSAWSTPSLV